MRPEDVKEIIQKSILHQYGIEEAQAIAKRYLEDIHHRYNITSEFFMPDQANFDQDLEKLSSGWPIQYVTGVEMFRGRFFSVTPDVLIPRPETEELVEMIIQEFEKKPLSILDLCTGSGCIAISLSLAFPGSNVWGTDVSSKALDIARKNATILQADVKFECSNLLKENPVYDSSVEFDIIVSNPPYIPMIDFNEVDSHVKDFEPHLALFVSGDDPFLFYRRIAAVAQERLKAGGYSYVEINRSFGNEVKAIFESAGLRDVSIFKDISGNERVVRSIKLD